MSVVANEIDSYCWTYPLCCHLCSGRQKGIRHCVGAEDKTQSSTYTLLDNGCAIKVLWESGTIAV